MLEIKNLDDLGVSICMVVRYLMSVFKIVWFAKIDDKVKI